MKKIFLVLSLLSLLYVPRAFSQNGSKTQVFLLTCGPGTETYSIYGHSALWIVDAESKINAVYNWGVFDFNTTNFAWKFAKGRLDYFLGVETIQDFLQFYMDEKRYVLSQKLNINEEETARLIALVNENLKPENLKYRYDFFYDDCSTRIRDIIEKSVGKNLLYPPVEKGNIPSFRDMVAKYQNPFPWYKFGVDLIMGSHSDIDASFRDRMFLPLDMKDGLSETVISRDGKMIPLLQNPAVILDFPAPVVPQRFLISPVSVFTIFLILIIIASGMIKTRKMNRWLDLAVYPVFSILAVLMVFFNFFTDHQQMKMNLNVIWLNPVIIICLIILILNKTGLIWFRILFFISAFFLVFHIFLPQDFNISFIPLVLILIVRSSVRSGFEWNPLSLK